MRIGQHLAPFGSILKSIGVWPFVFGVAIGAAALAGKHVGFTEGVYALSQAQNHVLVKPMANDENCQGFQMLYRGVYSMHLVCFNSKQAGPDAAEMPTQAWACGNTPCPTPVVPRGPEA